VIQLPERQLPLVPGSFVIKLVCHLRLAILLVLLLLRNLLLLQLYHTGLKHMVEREWFYHAKTAVAWYWTPVSVMRPSLGHSGVDTLSRFRVEGFNGDAFHWMQ